MKNKTVFLFNPLANEGRSVYTMEEIKKFFPKKSFVSYDLTQIDDLAAFIKQQNPQTLSIIGGDGTINHVAASIMRVPIKKRPILSVIPSGFGNALSYCLGVETLEKAVYVLLHPEHTAAIDVLQTNIPGKEFGIFNISVGFDARIVHARMHDRYIGLRSYILSAVKSIVTHPENKMTIIIDDSLTFCATASSLVIANAPTIGQNYVVAPFAKLNDGFLDCTLFSTRFAYLTNLRFKGFKHPLYSEIGKVHFKAKSIYIDGDPFVQVDGDPFVRQEGLHIAVKKEQLTFLCNAETHRDQMYNPFLDNDKQKEIRDKR